MSFQEHAQSKALVKGLVDDLKNQLGFEFSGLRHELQMSFNSMELAYIRGNNEILNELGQLKQDMASGFSNILCQGQEIDIYEPLRELRYLLNGIYHARNEMERGKLLDKFACREGEQCGYKPYDRFQLVLEKELMRALRGDQG